jgi:hypothetical protein
MNKHFGLLHRLLVRASIVLSGIIFLPFIPRVEAVPNTWQGEYFANMSLTAPAAYTNQELQIDFDWGKGGPKGLGSDFFSIRWTGDWDFESGEYTFFVYADDGLRLWLDDELLIDAWTSGMGIHQATKQVRQAGQHHMKLEYFERTGQAAIQFQWRRTDLYPLWQGEHFNNPWVEGSARYSREDRAIQFDWGDECPEELPPASCDSFSVSWEASPLLEAGKHRLHIYADEGYQLFVDNVKVQEDGWAGGGGSEDDWYDIEAGSTRTRWIAFNVHDRGGLAEARLWSENLTHPQWTAQYYSNTSLSGLPVVTEQETAVFYDWGLGRPRGDLPRDGFSVRWQGPRYFHSGCYRFHFFADDGVRLWVDGKLLVDAWQAGRDEQASPLTYLTTGYHNVLIEYFENAGEAEIRFWWE